jgi:hypothetical protein
LSGARLTVQSNHDAEIVVLDATLSKVGTAIGEFHSVLPNGLYKVRTNRAGALKDQLIELADTDMQVSLYISDFPAIAPIGSMVADQARLEQLAQKALRRVGKHALLFLEHVPANERRSAFSGLRAMPWRKVGEGIALGPACRETAVLGDEQWSAVALEVGQRGDSWVLEMRTPGFAGRQAIPIARDWQTRVFLRGLPGDNGLGAPYETSVQMARHDSSVVYWDQWETIEVARRALEAGRNIFTSDRLINELLHGKYDNPIAGMTGLHLMLDGLSAVPPEAWPRSKRELVDEVLKNLTGLLQPQRTNRLWDDPAWIELPDMAALRLRAGRLRNQIEVREPPLFKVSWDALKSAASRDGLIWIGRSLWRSTGDANRLGAYLAWAPRHHSWQQAAKQIGQKSFRDLAEMAEDNQLPRSIFETPRSKGVKAVRKAEANMPRPTELS